MIHKYAEAIGRGYNTKCRGFDTGDRVSGVYSDTGVVDCPDCLDAKIPTEVPDIARGRPIIHIGRSEFFYCGKDCRASSEWITPHQLRNEEGYISAKLEDVTCDKCKELWLKENPVIRTNDDDQKAIKITTGYLNTYAKQIDDPDLGACFNRASKNRIIKQEKKMEINKIAAEVYEKTEDALLVSKYQELFGLLPRADSDRQNSERNLMWLRANSEAVLTRAGELEAEKRNRREND